MSNTRMRILWGVWAGGAMMIAGLARGQEHDSADALYATGVRAYYSGNNQRAEEALSGALASQPQDPRLYYFRALSLLRLGRTAEARGDMLVGAALEAQQPNRYQVGKSLERVQGYNRLMLERFRRQARADASTQSQLNGFQQPSEIGQAAGIDDSGALRQRVVIPLDEYSRPGIPRPAAPVDAPSFAPRTFAPGPAVPAAGAQSPAGTLDDPFRDDPEQPAAGPSVAPAMPPADSRPAPETNESTSGGNGGQPPQETGTAPVGGATSDEDAEAPLDDADPFGS